MTGCPREHLEFTTWYLVQRKFAQRGDNTSLTITADGVESLEANYQSTPAVLRLRASQSAGLSPQLNKDHPAGGQSAVARCSPRQILPVSSVASRAFAARAPRAPAIWSLCLQRGAGH